MALWFRSFLPPRFFVLMIEHSDRRRSSEEQHSCRVITSDKNRFITCIALCQSSRHPPQYQAFCNSLRSLPRTPNAKSYYQCTTHRILRNGHWFRFSSSVSGERVEIKWAQRLAMQSNEETVISRCRTVLKSRPVKTWGPVDVRGHAMFGWPMGKREN